MSFKACVAMLLAGGEGRRLGVLTRSKAKPAVRFGGAYRIIDFGLSNCKNSGIRTVGVVTQYQAASLEEHIGEGTAWSEDADGISMLPPENGVYEGTADAVYKNQAFLERHDPEHVLILSGDHIYRMDYRKLLERHVQTQADATIAVTPVPWEEAHRFGIMRTDERGRVLEFSEKPKQPKSRLASMGIYIFRRSYLKQVLEADALDPQSSRDFGKDVIPSMLRTGAKLQTYLFEGYWRDVGTIESLWESHMDLIGEKPKFSCTEAKWPMYTSKAATIGQAYVQSAARIRQSIIASSCRILGHVEQSVVAHNVYVGHGSVLQNCVVMPGARIGSNVYLRNAIIGEDAVLEDGVSVEIPSHGLVAVVGDAETVRNKNQRMPKIYIPQVQLQWEHAK
ncbi:MULTISPECIES: glucose-1-phosphate adenylyltransferase [unclassified Paenibacillus]|uniref:glucose-1-phosphate adenylyltransferase n=1 Tax=unclassified Paenibacillus TaxID=185978 RepID=UPI001B71616B|nr:MULTISPECIES: glucose-1-phosphate adenylyltransferase [unclassified Paenibacillus]MBP1153896.1 glucose-1-phosphate adenylyltransferase [Paenibacillus sp. PvP091]MBP1170719.1 glucose-1-phosphate adenylyltransferase [Paenibacillus sp. PvR098]MBP2441747.1 glucose-1-phosphate adenylyltransferase [Paenibacillus sp. PvP052]